MLKKISLLALAGFAFMQTQAQTDTTKVPEKAGDTMHIGNIIILKNGSSSSSSGRSDWDINIYRRHHEYPSNITTNWVLLDLGFNGFEDKTNYSSLTSGYAAGTNKSMFDLRTGKSVNVNIWILMQRLNVIKHVVNLKYGIGLELNNYRFDSNIRYTKKPAGVGLDPDIDYRKNKLAADYVTVPLMLNFNFTPKNSYNRSFGFSAGVAGSYLYSSRQKFISEETGKDKTKGSLGLETFKLAYVAEVQLGPIKFYGNYSPESMYKEGLDHRPFAVGLRFSNW